MFSGVGFLLFTYSLFAFSVPILVQPSYDLKLAWGCEPALELIQLLIVVLQYSISLEVICGSV